MISRKMGGRLIIYGILALIFMWAMSLRPEGEQTGTSPPLLQTVLAILGIILVVVALFLLLMVVWNYIKYPPGKNPFRDGYIGVLLSRQQQKRHNELVASLSEHDPERFLREMDAFLKDEKLPKGLRRLASDNRAVGYLQRGDAARAIEIWEAVAADEQKMRDEHKQMEDGLRAVTHYNLCTAYLENGQVAEARKSYRILKEMQQSNKEWQARLQRVLLELDAHFFLTEGKYEKAGKAYRALLDDKGNAPEALHEHYALAQVYEGLGDVEKQKAHLKKVAKHGNQHHKAKKARETLGKLE